jgi:hypothetical protein
MQTSRKEHSYGCLTFSEYERGFRSAELTEKTQDDHFSAVPAESLQGTYDLLHLQSARRGLVGGRARVGEVKRRVQ